MSDQLTSQSRSNESGITRRTALRGAAWSASAVTVVVATPNIAAASPGIAVKPAVTVTPGTPQKYSVQSTKFVAWDVTVKCTNMDLSGLTFLLTYNQTGGGGKGTLDEVIVRNYSPAAAWSASVTKPSMTANATATYGGVVSKESTANVHIQFRGSDNSSGQVSLTVMAKDSLGSSVAVGTVPVTEWGSGSIHPH
nr:hypothetical protein [uncultured Nocardioides sp.]